MNIDPNVLVSADAPRPVERTAGAVEIDPLKQMQALMQRAKSGDETVVPHLRELLAEYPVLCRDAGDLTEQAQDGWLRLLAGSDLSQRVTIEHQLQSMRNESAAPTFPWRNAC